MAVGQLLSHEFLGGSLGGLPALGIIVAVAGVFVGIRMPLGVGIESGGCGEAQDPELEAQGCSARHASVFRIRYAPGEVRGCLVAQGHDEIHRLGEGIAGIMHLLVHLYGVVQDGDAAQIAEHVGIGDGHAHLRLGLPAGEQGGIGIRDAVGVLQEQPGITDDSIILLASEAVVLAARVGTGEVG